MIINLSSVPVPAEQGQLVVLGGILDLGAVIGQEHGGGRGGGGDAADGGAEAVADGILVPPAAAAGLRHKQP